MCPQCGEVFLGNVMDALLNHLPKCPHSPKPREANTSRMYPRLVIPCPRHLATCGVCGEPAALCFQGPPANPEARPEYGGVTFYRCHHHPNVRAEYTLWVTREPTIHQSRVATCGEDVEVEVDISGGSHGDYADVNPPDELPRCCPKGHEFTPVELAFLEAQVRLAFDQWVLSGGLDLAMVERDLAKVDSFEDR